MMFSYVSLTDVRKAHLMNTLNLTKITIRYLLSPLKGETLLSQHIRSVCLPDGFLLKAVHNNKV